MVIFDAELEERTPLSPPLDTYLNIVCEYAAGSSTLARRSLADNAKKMAELHPHRGRDRPADGSPPRR